MQDSPEIEINIKPKDLELINKTRSENESLHNASDDEVVQFLFSLAMPPKSTFLGH